MNTQPQNTQPQRRGLGRGLGELFQRTESPNGTTVSAPLTAPEMEPAASEQRKSATTVPDSTYFIDLPVNAITANPRQPRTVFDEEALAELVASIAEVGLLQPVVVRPIGHDRFELVMGERRWRACQQAGLSAIPAIVRETEDHDLLRDALLENLHRAQLNPLEEAAAYQQMLEDFGCTQEDLAARIKRSRPQISNTIRLLRLPPTVQRRVAAGVLSAGHARALLSVDDPAAQERLAQRVVAEGISVRAVEELVILGETGREPTVRLTAREVNPRVTELAELLTDHLETRVQIVPGKAKGKITVEFAGLEDLERLIASMTRIVDKML